MVRYALATAALVAITFTVLNVEVSGGSEISGPPIEATTTTTVTATTTTSTTSTTSTTVPKPVEIVADDVDVPVFRNDHADRWDQLAQCEAGGDWASNTGNGFGGGLQFMHQPNYSTWLSFGGGEYAADPWDASREQQIVVAEKVLASSGWKAWPGCSRKFGWL